MKFFKKLFKRECKHDFHKKACFACYTNIYRRTVIFQCEKCKVFHVFDRGSFFPKCDALNYYFDSCYFVGNEHEFKNISEEEAKEGRAKFLKKYLKEAENDEAIFRNTRTE